MQKLNNISKTGQELVVYKTMYQNEVVNWIVGLSTVNLETISKAGRMRVKYTPPEFYALYKDGKAIIRSEGIILFNTVEFKLHIQKSEPVEQQIAQTDFESFLKYVKTLPWVGSDELLTKLNRHTIY